jgi:hypothetical protein
VAPDTKSNICAGALAVAELLVRFLGHADGYYRRGEGRRGLEEHPVEGLDG